MSKKRLVWGAVFRLATMGWMVCGLMGVRGRVVAAAPVLPGPIAGPGSAQDQYQRFRQHQEQLDSLPPPSAKVQFAPEKAPQDASPACMPIHQVIVNGARHLSVRLVRRIAVGFEGRCLGVKDLNAVVNQLNDAYVKQGYITSRAYLPEQKLSSGVLTIVVLEGQLEGKAVGGGDGFPPD